MAAPRPRLSWTKIRDNLTLALSIATLTTAGVIHERTVRSRATLIEIERRVVDIRTIFFGGDTITVVVPVTPGGIFQELQDIDEELADIQARIDTLLAQPDHH